MADLTQLEAALVKADAAGDADGAKVLADEIRKVRAAPPQPPSMASRLMTAGVRGALGGPVNALMNVGAEAQKMGSETLERAAYDAGGRVTDATGSPGLGLATNVAVQAVPSIASGSVVGKAAAPLLERFGARVMQSAVKPSPADLISGDAQKAVQTLLKENINVNPEGMAELRKKIGALHDQVKQKIAGSSEMVDVNAATNVDRAYAKFNESLISRDANLQTIKDARDGFLKSISDLDPLSQYSGSIPVQLAQKLKQGTQKQISDNYGEMSGPLLEAGKDVAYGMRKGIEAKHPDVAQINEHISQLMNALSVSERHALMAANKNVGGLASLAENPMAAAAFMADRSELFKSLAARMIYHGAERLPQAVAGAATAASGVTNKGGARD